MLICESVRHYLHVLEDGLLKFTIQVAAKRVQASDDLWFLKQLLDSADT